MSTSIETQQQAPYGKHDRHRDTAEQIDVLQLLDDFGVDVMAEHQSHRGSEEEPVTEPIPIPIECDLRPGTPHTPHGNCPGVAPEYPSERVVEKKPMTLTRLASALGLLAVAVLLVGCGSGIADTVTAVGDTSWEQTEVTPTPQYPEPSLTPEPPPLPLPETDSFDEIVRESYLQALAEEGISLDDDTAMRAAELACQSDSLFGAVRDVTAATGLAQDDAAFLYGAALLTCDYGGQQ